MAGPQPSVPKKFLSFLPHRAKLLSGLSASVDSSTMNPGFLTTSGVDRNLPLQAIVDRRVLEVGKDDKQAKHPQLRGLRFALVDLTEASKIASPQFAGHRETEQGGLGSMAKLACMYAAYQLKFDLEELSRQKGLSAQQPLFDAARDIWNDTQKPDVANKKVLFPSDPKIELLGKLMQIDGIQVSVPRPFSSPDLEDMFTVVPASSGVVLRFKGSDRILVDPSVPGSPHQVTDEVKNYVAAFEHGNLDAVRKLSFAERMFLMIDNSDNPGAHACIENVSFLYIASSLWQSDIYSPLRGGGLWEGSTHDGAFRWQKPPVPRHNPKTDFVSASAASVAALLTLMEQDRLVNPQTCAGMRQLTSKKKTGFGSFTRSFFLEGLETITSTLDRIHSKLGIGDFRNDGAIVVRTVTDPSDFSKTKQIRYVATGFDDPTSDASLLHQLIVEFDKCIRENNGLLSPSAP
jgi:hypothetical protein